VRFLALLVAATVVGAQKAWPKMPSKGKGPEPNCTELVGETTDKADACGNVLFGDMPNSSVCATTCTTYMNFVDWNRRDLTGCFEDLASAADAANMTNESWQFRTYLAATQTSINFACSMNEWGDYCLDTFMWNETDPCPNQTVIDSYPNTTGCCVGSYIATSRAAMQWTPDPADDCPGSMGKGGKGPKACKTPKWKVPAPKMAPTADGKKKKMAVGVGIAGAVVGVAGVSAFMLRRKRQAKTTIKPQRATARPAPQNVELRV